MECVSTHEMEVNRDLTALPALPASPVQREADRCYTSQDEIFTFYIRREMFMRILHNNTIAFIFLHFDISNKVLLHHTNVVLKVGKV